MEKNVCKIAVSSAIFSIDKPYSYLIPDEMLDEISVGKRVLVPFSKGNKKAEGFVLKISRESETKGFKRITRVLDEKPLFDENMLKLALFMQKRYYAPLYEVLKTMLPSGFWFNSDDKYILKDDINVNILDELSNKSEKFREILSILAVNLEIHEKDVAKGDFLKEIKHLLNEKIVSLKTNSKIKVSDKLEKFYFLNKNLQNHRELAYKGIKKEERLKIVELLFLDEKLSFSEISYLTGASKSVINTLVKQGVLDFCEQSVYRENSIDYTIKDIKRELSEEQNAVFSDLSQNLKSEETKIDLLFGVTGSGKTQIYIELLKECQNLGKGAIVLIPEIALTTQLLSKFTEVFGKKVAILHSKLTATQRVDEWKKVSDGFCDIVIGTRSAVFAPLKNLGLIIIDEEHESSYKSDKSPRYNAKDIAKYRVLQDNAMLLLSSATPSVESFYNATKGNMNLHILKKRYGKANLPDVFIEDMKETYKKGIETSISERLYEEMVENLNNNEQTILFLNRRGNSKKFTCLNCGYVPECVNCSINMTYHSVNERIMCHLCGYSYDRPEICPKCSSRHIKTDNFGTQMLEIEVKNLFPEARILRLDADTNRKANNTILDDFKRQKADILIGTQMVTKGLDFENATLVGVIDADMSLFSEDYLGFERTFSQITQVCGRAGRHEKRGRAIIQTLNPDHNVINFSKNNDYEGFYSDEIARRKALRLPPISDIFSFVITSEVETNALKSAVSLAEKIKYIDKNYDFSINVLGPVPARILKINKKYRYVLTIRINKDKTKFISGILREFYSDKRNKNVNIYVDLDGEC